MDGCVKSPPPCPTTSATSSASVRLSVTFDYWKNVKWHCISANLAEGAELAPLTVRKVRCLDEPAPRRMLQVFQKEPITWWAPTIFDLLSGLHWQDMVLDTSILQLSRPLIMYPVPASMSAPLRPQNQLATQRCPGCPFSFYWSMNSNRMT